MFKQRAHYGADSAHDTKKSRLPTPFGTFCYKEWLIKFRGFHSYPTYQLSALQSDMVYICMYSPTE